MLSLLQYVCALAILRDQCSRLCLAVGCLAPAQFTVAMWVGSGDAGTTPLRIRSQRRCSSPRHGDAAGNGAVVRVCALDELREGVQEIQALLGRKVGSIALVVAAAIPCQIKLVAQLPKQHLKRKH